MGSEAPENDQIFFKDMQNELKGPFTERQVQDWYREKWFENSFPFYFMQGDERPNVESPFLTLGELRTINGSGCPFKSIDAKSSRSSMEEKLRRLEKEVADLSKKCDEITKLEKRMEDVENRLDALLAAHVMTISVSVAAETDAGTSTKPVVTAVINDEAQENSDHVKWANKWASFLVDILKEIPKCKTNEAEKVLGKRRCHEMDDLMRTKVFKSELATEKCREVMFEMMQGLDYFFCMSCDVVCLNYKQIFLHIFSAHKNEPLWKSYLETLIGSECKRLKKEEVKMIAEMHSKYSKLDARAAHLRPTLSFVDEGTSDYGDAVCDYMGNIGSNRAQIMSKMIPRIKQKHLGPKMMRELHEHIGDGQTRCYYCWIVTGAREEYYKHIRTHSHLVKENAMDLITLVVNMFHDE